MLAQSRETGMQAAGEVQGNRGSLGNQKVRRRRVSSKDQPHSELKGSSYHPPTRGHVRKYMDFEIRKKLSGIPGDRKQLRHMAEDHWVSTIRPTIMAEEIAREAMKFSRQHRRQPESSKKALRKAQIMCPWMNLKIKAHIDELLPIAEASPFQPPLGEKAMSRFISGVTAYSRLRTARRAWIHVLNKYLDWRCRDA